MQLDLFDERNLISLTHEDYPGERLIACRNPALAKLRAEKRKDLIAATTRELEKVAGMVAGGRLQGADKIGLRVGQVANKYKVAKHFELDIERRPRSIFKVDEERVAAEAALDGLYVHPHFRCDGRHERPSRRCSTTSAWPRWNEPSARSKASISMCARSVTVWRRA